MPSSIFSIAPQEPLSHLQASTEELIVLLCSGFVVAENGCCAAQSSQFASDLGAEAEERDTRGVLYQHPYFFSFSFLDFFLLPSPFGHSQQDLLLRFLVDTAVGVCGICPGCFRACVLDFGVIHFCNTEEISVFTYPVVRGDGQTVTCSLGIVADSKLFANLAPH